MATIHHLPPEILLEVIATLDVRDLWAFALTSRKHYALANPVLYLREIQNRQSPTFYLAAEFGRMGTLQRFIEAGIDVNRLWRSQISRSDLEYRRFARRLSTHDHKDPAFRDFLRARMRRAHERRHFRPYEGPGELICPGRHLPQYAPGICNWDGYDPPDCALHREWERFREESRDRVSSEGRPANWERIDDEQEPMLAAIFYYWSALHCAALNGHNDAVELLLSNGADIHSSAKGLCQCTSRSHRIGIWQDPRDGTGDGLSSPRWTPLHIALCHGKASTARLLLSHGASAISLETAHPDICRVSSADLQLYMLGDDDRFSTLLPDQILGGMRTGITALHLACHIGSLELVQELLEDHRLDVDVRDALGQTPLAYAYFAGHLGAIMLYLLSKGANINTNLGIRTPAGRVTTMLHDACWHARYEDAARLIELGAGVNYTLIPTRMSPLHICCRITADPFNRGIWWISEYEARRSKLIRMLIGAGAKIDALDDRHCTPLAYAAQCLLVPVASELIAAGADVSIRNRSEETLIMLAAVQGEKPMEQLPHLLSLLVQKGAPVNAQSDTRSTALHMLCERRHPDEDHARSRDAALRFLLEKGADLSIRDHNHQLPFHNAYRQGNRNACLLLLEYGSAKQLTTKDFELLYACTIGRSKRLSFEGTKLDLLLEAGGRFLLARPETLRAALLAEDNKMAKQLLKNGASPYHVSPDGETLLHIACRSDLDIDISTLEKLLETGLEVDAVTTDGETALARLLSNEFERHGGALAPDEDISGTYFTAVETLLRYGADPHRCGDLREDEDEVGIHGVWCRPLERALNRCQEYTARSIIRFSSLPCTDRAAGARYLHQAVYFAKKPPDPNFVAFLLEHGVDANVRDYGFSVAATPLSTMLCSFVLGPPGAPSRYWIGDRPACDSDDDDDDDEKGYAPVDHVDALVQTIAVLESHGADWLAPTLCSGEFGWEEGFTPLYCLKTILAYDGEDQHSWAMVFRLKGALARRYRRNELFGDIFYS
ncbi:ankyrin repeat-containing domain protein [Xylariomycetidae sp. FL0641]|nr:ankyrin repeat-containing domain protein [Xylariomycetidae sp. FL0641]